MQIVSKISSPTSIFLTFMLGENYAHDYYIGRIILYINLKIVSVSKSQSSSIRGPSSPEVIQNVSLKQNGSHFKNISGLAIFPNDLLLVVKDDNITEVQDYDTNGTSNVASVDPYTHYDMSDYDSNVTSSRSSVESHTNYHGAIPAMSGETDLEWCTHAKANYSVVPPHVSVYPIPLLAD